MKQFHSQRGEVAWLLTVVSMVVIAAGLFVGFNVSTQEEAAIRIAPQAAQPTTGAQPIPRILEQTGVESNGMPIRNTDGYFSAIGGTCQATFETHIDPTIVRVLIARPTSEVYPNYKEPGDVFDLTASGAGELVGKPFLKNNIISVRFNPNDQNKSTPNLNDVLVTYKSSAEEKQIIIDQGKVPDWIRTESVDVVLVFTYTKNQRYEFFTTSVSTGCVVPSVTPRDTITPTTFATPTEEPVATIVFPSEIPTETPADTPTPTDSLRAKSQALSCEYNALGFVEECLETNAQGECVRVSGSWRNKALAFNNSVLDPNPSSSDNRDKWGILNNLQLANSLRPEALRPASIMHLFSGATFSRLYNTFSKFDFSTNINRQSQSYTSLSGIWETAKKPIRTQKGNPRELLEQRDGYGSLIKLAVKDTLSVSEGSLSEMELNERYVNFDSSKSASVRLAYDSKKYAILPNGSKIYSCTNSIVEKLDPKDPRAKLLGACDERTYNEYKSKEISDPKSVDRSTIPGLVVGCGQNIVYGWTLQKCMFDFDFVFVLDTSSTMGTTVDKKLGMVKLEAAKIAITQFLENVSGGDKSRAALITFNTGVEYYTQNPQTNEWTFNENRFLGYHGDFKPVYDFLKELPLSSISYKPGTCIECGLADTRKFLNDRQDKSRQAVVVLLSDGQPNSYNDRPGMQVLPLGFAPLFGTADKLRADGKLTSVANPLAARTGGGVKSSKPTLLVSVGYGDTSVQQGDGQNFDVLYGLASDRNISSGRSGRWIYSTDPAKYAQTGVPYDTPNKIDEIFKAITADVNSCAQVTQAFASAQKAKDVNSDGIVNTLDLFLVYDNYYAKGDNLKEDINADGVVNVHDVTLVISSLGSVVTPAEGSATPAGATNR